MDIMHLSAVEEAVRIYKVQNYWGSDLMEMCIRDSNNAVSGDHAAIKAAANLIDAVMPIVEKQLQADVATVSYTHLDVYKRQGTYKKECIEQGKKYFSVASGGGTGRTLHPDNMAAGPASYGMTDTMGRMHSDAQFAGSSSVPAHVEMMGLIDRKSVV